MHWVCPTVSDGDTFHLEDNLTVLVEFLNVGHYAGDVVSCVTLASDVNVSGCSNAI